MCTPIYVAPLSYFVLKEKVSKYQIGAILLAFVGILLIARPAVIFGDFENSCLRRPNKAIGVGLAFVAAISTATGYVVLRKVPRTSSTVVIIWFSVISIFLGISSSLILHLTTEINVRLPETANDWIWINVSGFLGVVNQFLFVQALKLESANIVSLVRTLDIVFSFVIQAIFLKHQKILWTSIVGAIIVFVTVLVLFLVQFVKIRIQTHREELLITQRKSIDKRYIVFATKV